MTEEMESDSQTTNSKLKTRNTWAGIRYCVFAIACFVLAAPIAGALAGIAVYFRPKGMDSVDVGWSTTIYSMLAIPTIEVVAFVLGMIKGGKYTRRIELILTILGLTVFGLLYIWT